MNFRLCVAFFWLTSSICAQPTEIKGKAESLPGYEIRLLSHRHPVSREVEILDVDTIDEDGSFAFDLNIESTRSLILAIHRSEALLFAQPGANYELAIPDQAEFELLKTWRPSFFTYYLLHSDSDDVNLSIAAFDRSYYEFYESNAAFIGTREIRRKVDEFAAKQELEDSYAGDYRQYSLAEMKLSAGYPKKVIFDTYLRQSEFPFDNPAFGSFFSTFFADYFGRFDLTYGGESIPNRLANGMDYEELDSLLLKDDFLQEPKMRQWVMLHSIHDNLYALDYPEEPLLKLLHTLKERSASDAIERAAGEILRRHARLTDPVPLDDLSLTPRPDHQGKQALLSIGHLDSQEYQRELMLTDDLSEEYGAYFEVIAVYLPGERDTLLSEQLTRPVSTYALMERLNIRSLPWYGWVNEDGLIVERETAKPSEGLRERLYTLRAKKAEEQKIRIGQ